jgi:hypothetical protein
VGKVADAAVEVLRETGNPAVMWGDNGLVDLIATRAGIVRDGPGTMARVLGALSRRPGRLIAGKTRLGNGRLVRIFRLPTQEVPA